MVAPLIAAAARIAGPMLARGGAAGAAGGGAAGGGAAGGGFGRAALQFGLGALGNAGSNQSQATQQRQQKQDSGFSQYVKENPVEAGIGAGVSIAKALNTPGLGAQGAASFSALSTRQFG